MRKKTHATQFRREQTHTQHSRARAVLFVSFLPRKLRMIERVVHRCKGQANIYILLSTVADNQLRVQAKAKHEMLANLVLPAFIDEPPRTRERRIERRNTFTFQAPSMRTKKDGMYPSWIAAFSGLPRYPERETPESQGPRMSLMVYAYCWSVITWWIGENWFKRKWLR